MKIENWKLIFNFQLSVFNSKLSRIKRNVLHIFDGLVGGEEWRQTSDYRYGEENQSDIGEL